MSLKTLQVVVKIFQERKGNIRTYRQIGFNEIPNTIPRYLQKRSLNCIKQHRSGAAYFRLDFLKIFDKPSSLLYFLL